MKQRIWFKAKSYGYGWYPATWEGWLVLAIFFLIFISDVVRMLVSKSLTDLFVWYLPEVFVITGTLIFICYLTGEKPEWRWAGKPLRRKEKK